MDFKIEPVITEGLVGILLPRRARKLKGKFFYSSRIIFSAVAQFSPSSAILICIRRWRWWRFGGGQTGDK